MFSGFSRSQNVNKEVNGRHAVVKQIHHEPCGYYQFGNKVQAEMNDYVNAESMEAIVSYERSEE